MKKVCIFMHKFCDGGAEKMTIFLANSLVNQGYDVTFLMRDSHGETEELVDKRIKIIDMHLSSFGKIKKNFINMKILIEILKSDYDVILSITTAMSQLLMMACALVGKKKYKAKIVPIIHNTLSMERMSFAKIRQKLYFLFQKYSDKVVVVSKSAANDFVKVTKVNESKVIAIYNPVITKDIFTKISEKCEHRWLDVNRTYKTFITAGRLTEQKNQKMMLKAFAEFKKINKENKDAKLIILGRGELKQELIELSINLGIDRDIDFYGYTDNPYTFFRNSDAFLLSSIYEGLPTVLIEALFCGCHIISTDCPSGVREILDNGKYGIITKVEDVQQFAAAMKSTFDQKYDMNEIKLHCQKFESENVMRQYTDLIESI